MREGQWVTYVGEQQNSGPQPGANGRLLMFASSVSAHVQMGQDVYLVCTDDLVESRKTAQRDPEDLLQDSLEVGGLSAFAVRTTYEDEGEVGVLNAMASLGHLTAFSEIAEEALSLVAGRIRQDPSFREVLAHLDDEEGESLLRLASAALIRDAFGEVGEEG